MTAAGVGFNDAGINGKAFAFNKTRVHARKHHRLEYLPKYVAVRFCCKSRRCEERGNCLDVLNPSTAPASFGGGGL
jgi:hypothetical protein